MCYKTSNVFSGSVVLPNCFLNSVNDFSFCKGRRVVARKMVFLVIDGQSNVEQQLTIPKADALKNSGVQTFVVAVGTYIYDIDELVKVASYPPKQFLFRVKELSGFWKIIKMIITEVSPGKYNIVNGQYDPPR